MTKDVGRVLVVAGSDSGGGAGIQADIKTITALGCYAMTAVTALTVQNTKGVYGVWPAPIDVVLGQIDVTLSDIGADAIKTGMLGSVELVESVAERLSRVEDAQLIVDPVMVATSGDILVDKKSIDAVRSELVPLTNLLTPNAPEAEVLSGKSVENVDGQRRVAEYLLKAGAKGVLVKGGHIGGSEIVDVLQTEHGEWIFKNPRVETTSTHGTGCSLASACAAKLAIGQEVQFAVEEAITYLQGALKSGVKYGHGSLDHAWNIRAESESKLVNARN